MAVEPSPLAASNVSATDVSGVAEPTVRSEQVIRLERFDTNSERDWSALMRDILALANSGGGRILCDSPIEESEVLNRLPRYTDSDFGDVRVWSEDDSNRPNAVIAVGESVFPVGFSAPAAGTGNAEAPATADIAPGFYFRHGERTEQGATADMRSFVARLLRRVRRRWLRGIRRVLTSRITLDEGVAPRRQTPKRIRLERAVLQPVRIVSDPNAPALQPQDVEQLYPWRQKDLLAELNQRLGRPLLTTYDIQAVRRHHQLDERPDFVFHLPGAGRRYSPAVADWIIEQYGRDPEFFHVARVADQAMLRLRRKKPR